MIVGWKVTWERWNKNVREENHPWKWSLKKEREGEKKEKSPARPGYTTPFSYGTVPLSPLLSASRTKPRSGRAAAGGRDLRQESEGKVWSDSSCARCGVHYEPLEKLSFEVFNETFSPPPRWKQVLPSSCPSAVVV